jgi:hypothetical protein
MRAKYTILAMASTAMAHRREGFSLRIPSLFAIAIPFVMPPAWMETVQTISHWID